MMAFGMKEFRNLDYHLSFLSYHSNYTSRLLDLLDEFNIPATFFVLGQSISEYPSVAQRIAASHTIASHTWSHNNLTWMDIDAVRDDLTRTNDAIEAATGVRPKYFRATYGYKSTCHPIFSTHYIALGRAMMRLTRW